MVQNYNDFIETLLAAGFSMWSGNDDGIYSAVPIGNSAMDKNKELALDTPICWFTGNPDTDPCVWSIRIFNERNDIAYAKLFNKKSGYITKNWYHYFLAVRREGKTFEDRYAAGEMSHFAKRIYEVITSNDRLPVHNIKELGGFSKKDKPGFDRALTELQMKMFITICGAQQKQSQTGKEYAWPSNVFCTTEYFWGSDVFERASDITKDDAYGTIRKQILELNPLAQEKKISKFILG